MPAVAQSRNGLLYFEFYHLIFVIIGKYLAFQSMDNQIRIMEPLANFRWKSKKLFKGHMVSDGLIYMPNQSNFRLFIGIRLCMWSGFFT
jgi:hypothetical protein